MTLSARTELDIRSVLPRSRGAVVLVSRRVIVFISSRRGVEGTAAHEEIDEGLEDGDAACDDDGTRFDAEAGLVHLLRC